MITSRQNALVRHLKRLGGERKYRYEHGEFLGAGLRCLEEAVTCGCDVTAVLAVPGTPGLENLPVTEATEELVQYASPLKTSPQAVFACKIPQNRREIDARLRYIILDGVQDPGNVGTIIRSAAAFGADGVLLINDCADPYNPKTVRATMGALFRINIAETDAQSLSEAVTRGLVIYGASADGAESATAVSLRGVSIAVGSEGAGLSAAMLELCAKRVSIPMHNSVESLNAAVAASVLLWEAAASR